MTIYAAGVIPQFDMRDRLRKAREITGLDQGEFANRIGVARQTINNAERGAKEPSRLVVRAWALGAGVPLQWLETGTAPDGPGPNGELPGLDSNQEPSDSRVEFAPVITLRPASLPTQVAA